MRKFSCISITVLLLTLLFFNNCERNRPRKNFGNLEITKAWFRADSTSYWIYKVNGVSEDSITGSLKNTWFKRKSTKVDIYDELYEFHFNKKNMGYISIFGPIYLIELRSSYGGDGGSIDLYNDAAMQQHFSKNRGPNYSMDTMMSNYVANGIEFGNTIVYSVYPDGVQQTDTGIYYFSKGVGITRMIDKGHKRDMQLIRYKYVRLKDLE